MQVEAAVPQQSKALIENAVILEELDTDLYKSKNLWRPSGARGVFGGQVVGQSLMAATRTVPSHFEVHSLHSYFLLPGDPEKPIIYKVNRVRDGKSYCTRTVNAIQNGRGIFVCEVSFHIPEETDLNHQYVMPKVARPESLPTREELVKKILDDPNVTPEISKSIRFHIFEPFDLEIRFTESITVSSICKAEAMEPRQIFWIRVGHCLPDDDRLHQCIAAYATDHLLLSTALRPTGLHMWNPKVTFMATLDHCIWFHAPFRVDQWLLYEMESPRATAGRGFALGRLYAADGRLVLSCAQEGVVRIKSKCSVYGQAINRQMVLFRNTLACTFDYCAHPMESRRASRPAHLRDLHNSVIKADLFLDADQLQQDLHRKPSKDASRSCGMKIRYQHHQQMAAMNMMGMIRTHKVPVILPKPDDRKRDHPESFSLGRSTGGISTEYGARQMSLESVKMQSERCDSMALNGAYVLNSPGLVERKPTKLPFQQPQYTGCRYDVAKPPYSYASLIAQSLLATPNKRLTLNQIYAWIMDKYPYYRSENHGWQNSIRHNLSLNSCFVKLAKSDKDSGKGSYWTLNEQELAAFKDGEFKRRKLNGTGRNRKKRRHTFSEVESSVSLEPIAPSICDTDIPGSEDGHQRPGFDGMGEVAGSLRSTPFSSDSMIFDWQRLACGLPMRINDPQVNGTLMQIGEVLRMSSSSMGGVPAEQMHISIDYVCPELEERGCLGFNTWELQRSAADVRTDYTDPMEILQKL